MSFKGTLIGLLTVVFTPTTALGVNLYRTVGNPLSYGMQDLDIGSDGDVFAVGTENISGTNGYLYRWVNERWEIMVEPATRVAVDSQGRPWIIDALGAVSRYDGTRFRRINGVVARAIDIGPGPNGDEIFVIRTNGRVARYVGSSFVDFSGSGVEITVDGQGHPWLVNGSQQIWEYDGTRWNRHPGVTARDIDAGAYGPVYMLQGGGGSNGTIFRYDGGARTWVNNGGYGTRIAVAPTGAPAIINSSEHVWSNFVRRIHGDTACGSGERDCNVCAFDVRGQFASMFRYGHRTNTTTAWTMNWNQRYAPSYRTPSTAFEDGRWVISSDHVQGFVRTGNISRPYAGSYSDDTLGSVFIVERYAPLARLGYLHASLAGEDHPSGVHALGHYVAVNENRRLRLHDTDAPFAAVPSYTPPVVNWFGTSGGGLGLARISQSRYLVASTTPGGGKSGPRSTYFWSLEGAIGASGTNLQFLGGGGHQLPWGNNFNTNENLSLITECETGQIYGVHTSGDAEVFGDGFWRVSRLEQGPYGPVLRALDYYTEGQNMATCYLRAAATAYANDSNGIATYCHQYDARNDNGSSSGALSFVARDPSYASSCVARCGDQAPSGCWCDQACAGLGDCCNDAEYHCPF